MSDEALKLNILSIATGVSRPKIRQLLQIYREIETNELIRRHAKHQNRPRCSVDVLDGGCALYMPKFHR